MADQTSSVDAYIASFPDDVGTVLSQVRHTIGQAVPNARETISYRIPAVTVDGKTLVYFAGWKHHVSVYPVPAGDAAFQSAVAPYRAGRGTLRFPLGQPVPHDLVADLVTWRLREQGD
jgi:uncharacterized protein YdhG (YjbR/CyaY superfamily)